MHCPVIWLQILQEKIVHLNAQPGGYMGVLSLGPLGDEYRQAGMVEITTIAEFKSPRLASVGETVDGLKMYQTLTIAHQYIIKSRPFPSLTFPSTCLSKYILYDRYTWIWRAPP